MNLTELQQALRQLKAEQPKLRTRQQAQKLGISEATLLSLNLDQNCVLLDAGESGENWKSLLLDIHQMGYVMALTRNEHAVHERKGVYENIEFYKGAHNMGVAVNPDIDLRFFMSQWVYCLAVIMPKTANSTLYSFQFFNANGEAVHKIFSTPKSNIKAYHDLVKKYRASKQEALLSIEIDEFSPSSPKPDEEIDKTGFQEAWRNLQDTHDFFGMLRKFEVTRTQGLRLAPEGFTQRVDNQAVVRTLELASERKVPIMCFLHSKGCVQIHTGPVKKLQFFGDWYNVLDPKFNLHLSMPSVKETWIVKKPTVDGLVTSLELFDGDGQLITYFFGARKPGIPELPEWQDIIGEVSPSPVLNS